MPLKLKLFHFIVIEEIWLLLKTFITFVRPFRLLTNLLKNEKFALRYRQRYRLFFSLWITINQVFNIPNSF